LRVGIVGATGYVGAELIRILSRHPNVDIVGLAGRDRQDEPIAGHHPHLADSDLTVGTELPEVDAAFLALPHGAAVGLVPDLIASGTAVIDLGPDFRLRDADDYPRWYGFEHSRPDLLEGAVYGLPELHRDELRGLSDEEVAIVGSPGCYPTATLLALAPLARAGLIGDLVVDAKSGVSGAGREPKAEMMFGEVDESVKAYGLGGHRHVAEIEQELAFAAVDGGLDPDANPGAIAVDFLPHLIPMVRGILSTNHVRPTRSVTQAEVDALYRSWYDPEPFVRVVTSPPATKHTTGSNFVHVYVTVDDRTGRIIAIAVEDNLVKGAAGQAVQSFNIVHGLPETAGLEQHPLVP
jgi:N-acetyl-gamma-glutamyl-phosphate reductase